MREGVFELPKDEPTQDELGYQLVIPAIDEQSPAGSQSWGDDELGQQAVPGCLQVEPERRGQQVVEVGVVRRPDDVRKISHHPLGPRRVFAQTLVREVM